MLARMPRVLCNGHLDFIRGLPCLICGNDIETQAAHIRYGDRSAGKRQTGMGEKPDDSFTIPLCGQHHREQHDMNEMAFWVARKIDPIRVALALWRATGNHELGCQIVAANGGER